MGGLRQPAPRRPTGSAQPQGASRWGLVRRCWGAVARRSVLCCGEWAVRRRAGVRTPQRAPATWSTFQPEQVVHFSTGLDNPMGIARRAVHRRRHRPVQARPRRRAARGRPRLALPAARRPPSAPRRASRNSGNPSGRSRQPVTTSRSRRQCFCPPPAGPALRVGSVQLLGNDALETLLRGGREQRSPSPMKCRGTTSAGPSTTSSASSARRRA